MASFTHHPIVNSDKTQDLDLDVCQYYVLWSYGGTMTNFTSPVTLNYTAQIFSVFQYKKFVCQTIAKVILKLVEIV